MSDNRIYLFLVGVPEQGKRGAKQGAKQVSQARGKSNNVFLQGCEKGQRNLFVFDRCKSRDATRENLKKFYSEKKVHDFCF